MIEDLCIIMLTAGLTSLLFKVFKQPVVLGYIVAGMLVGPHVLGGTWISDEESVETWGEIGVLFLLFSLGLEFSFKKLIEVGSTALISAGVIVVGMMTTGYIVGLLFGWSSMNALFLGGMLCMSSTTIVFKAIEDSGLRSHKFAKVCFGILIVEDLFAVVLMVLLSSIAVKNSFEGKELLMQVGKLVGYLLVWFVMGIILIPSFLKKFKKHLNDETLTIFSIGMCLGMVLLAVNAGFSSALGAFVMGSVLAETIEAEKIEKLVQPIKNIFGSIFFVSVGMMIEPTLLVEYWIPIVILTLIVVIGQIFFASIGTLLSGQSLRVSLQTGFALVQIGEFAFIIASLGQSLGVTDKSLYPIVVAVSVVTTFLTPYIMNLAYPTLDFFNAHMSPQMKFLLDNYAQARNKKESKSTVWLQQIGAEILKHIVSLPILRKLFSKFTSNLYARETLAEEKKTLNSSYEKTLMALDIHISEFSIPENSSFCGKNLKELSIRKESGAVIVGIIRGDITINVPGGERHIYPHDKLIVAGTDTQMTDFQEMLNGSIDSSKEKKTGSKLVLDNIFITPDSPLIGKNLIQSGIKDKAKCIVMGISRLDEDIYMNPDPTIMLKEGDVLILVGEKESINKLKTA